ncbi:MAG: TRAP transporter large permease [Kiloniellaceae bacterium]
MIWIGLLFAVLLLLGLPVAFTIGIAGFLFFVLSDILPMSIGVQKIASVSQSFPLLAVPFFVLAGHLMNESGITERLFRFSKVTVGWMAGGLAQVSVVLSTLMGGVSGSAVADAAMEARVLGPTMLGEGYAKGYTAAVIAISSLITATIPPSLGLILYGYVGNVSIGQLFLAGIVPGLLMMLVLMVTAYVIAKRRGYRSEGAVAPRFGEVMRALGEAKFALAFPVLLVLSIRGGLFTPSEVGAFAVIYAILVGRFAHGALDGRAVLRAFEAAICDIGMIMLIILMSGMIGYAIIFEQMPQSIAQALLGLSSEPLVIFLLILVMLFVAGLFIESTVLVLLLTPIFVPIVTQIGVDPVHFGVLMMTIVTLGSMTPPVGVAMYTVCALLDCDIGSYVKESLPFVAAIIALVAVLVLLPELVLFLPRSFF